jgi:acetoin:2,6-dichlorophenolindophenol oxidoreductase subunit beta
MERTLTYVKAIGEAMSQEMARDPSVVSFGEDNIGGMGCDGKLGNAWGPTQGLYEKFPNQILDTPITEAAFVGAAVGAAASGLRPIVDLLFADFMGVAFDQLINQAAKLRYMFGGQGNTPLVVRTLYGAGMRGGAQHSQSLYSLVTHVPGLKVVIPATPYDAKGLMTEAIRDEDPVIYFEHKMLYWTPGEVPVEPYSVPFGQSRLVRAGIDCTVVALGRMVGLAEQASVELAAEGIDVEIIDPRTVSPLDEASIYRSVEKTGRLVVVDESPPRCGMARDIAALVAENRFASLRGPVRTVTAPHSPVPYSPGLEDRYIPSVEEIARIVRKAVHAPEMTRRGDGRTHRLAVRSPTS